MVKTMGVVFPRGKLAFQVGNGQRVRFWMDKWCGDESLCECGTFSIKSLYSILEPEDSPWFPSGSIWRSSVPPKVAFFTWKAFWGKVLALNQLQRRGNFLANRCFLCLSKAKTVDHLLHCAKTRVLWNFLFSLFGVSWILSCSVEETLLRWHGSFVGKARKRLGK
ncbi:hypothetical protein AAG906_003219 [Vitis piasezkii]